MQFSTAQIQLILDELNQPSRLKEFRALTTPELRRAWKERENDPYDTSGSELRRLHVEWMDGVLQDLRRRHYPDTFVGVETTDFYFYTGQGKEAARERSRLEQLSFVELPVQAFKIRQSVFVFSKREKRWIERPWLGADKDPLLALPYSRKYDRERAQAADRRETWQWEKLCRAQDLVEMLAARVESLQLSRSSIGCLELPKFEVDDILEALALDDLALGQCEIGGIWHATEFEILPLEEWRNPRTGDFEKRAHGPALATGGYDGALNKIRYGSAATKKAVMVLALEALYRKLMDICWPLDDDEEDARAALVEQMIAEVDGELAERVAEILAARDAG